MDYEIYDPEKHEIKVSSRDGRWLFTLERANNAWPNGIVIRDLPKNSVSPSARKYGYKYKTRSLSDGSGFVLWAEKIQ